MQLAGLHFNFLSDITFCATAAGATQVTQRTLKFLPRCDSDPYIDCFAILDTSGAPMMHSSGHDLIDVVS